MPVTKFTLPDPYAYQPGFHTYHETTAVPGALPIAANSPQKPPLGLYAEKLSGTPFTAPRAENLQAWLYRILPAAAHSAFSPRAAPRGFSGAGGDGPFPPRFEMLPNQLRWSPFDAAPDADFVTGQRLLSGAGDPALKQGLGIYTFSAARSMPPREAFYSADGDLLVVPQRGVLDVATELGRLLVRAGEICVIPRGVRYRVEVADGESVSGYALELYQGHFRLPELGPIGADGLANGGDFQAPVAWFEKDTDSTFTVVAKFAGRLFEAKQKHTPFDVVAWRGNYYPYKYDLGRFNTIGTISYDHPDPSIFTVLTAQSDHPGTAIADFVIFPPRWLVGEDTFRPPYYHRNCKQLWVQFGVALIT
jgi:homogentisate 1,2-dioxygenase